MHRATSVLTSAIILLSIGHFQKAVLAKLLGLINDPRDMPFVRLIISSALVIVPFATALFIPGVFRWWLAGVYLLANFVGYLDRFTLMLHNTSHRPLFKRRWMNKLVPWGLGPFFGQTPESFFVHHVGMHHYECNLADDLSTTMPYERDNLLHFLHYYFGFITVGLLKLAAYLTRKKRRKLHAALLTGELIYFAVMITLFFVNWRATLVVFFIPLVVIRFLMLAGNWAQHAFIDAQNPECPYRNSITCLGVRYNRRCWNDGYHIGHHLKSNRHWTEMPAEFEDNRALYHAKHAIVFQRLDHFKVWALLMLRDYRHLGRHYLPLGESRPSEDAIIALLRERTRPFQR